MKTLTILILSIALPAFAGPPITNLHGKPIEMLLPATVTSEVVTNTVSGNNQRGCATCNMLANGGSVVPAIYHPWHEGGLPFVPATEAWSIENVVRRITLTVDWNGEKLMTVKEVPISSVTNRFTLKSEWVKE